MQEPPQFVAVAPLGRQVDLGARSPRRSAAIAVPNVMGTSRRERTPASRVEGRIILYADFHF